LYIRLRAAKSTANQRKAQWRDYDAQQILEREREGGTGKNIGKKQIKR